LEQGSDPFRRWKGPGIHLRRIESLVACGTDWEDVQ
jgi:hypothetical protein